MASVDDPSSADYFRAMNNHFIVLTTLSVLALAAFGSATSGGTEADVPCVQAWSDAALAAQAAGGVQLLEV